jgi:nicotinamidase-related amidase
MVLARQAGGMTIELAPDSVLIVIDVQQGFEDPVFGKRDNPDAEANVARLIDAWTASARPIVRVRHADDDGPLHPDHPGHAYKPFVAAIEPDLEIVKTVHSAFLGTPDLHAWLAARGAGQVVICGIQTNRCCETTARFAGNLGYDMLFALDATHTFDEGDVTAGEFSRITAANLHDHFGRVATTDALVAAA